MIPELPELPPLLPPAVPAIVAAPATPPTVVQAPPTEPTFPSVGPATEQSFRAFEALVGGRALLAGKLALVAQGKAEDQIVGLLADPRNDKISLAAICRKGRIQLRQLMELYRDASLVQAQVSAIDKVAAGLPGVAADVMTRSVTHYIDCYACNGTTTYTPEPTKDIPNPGPQPCETCSGVGKLIAQPNHEVQKTALTLGGLLRKDGGGVQVNVQQNNNQIVGLGASGGFDDLVEKLDTVLFGTARDRIAQRAHTVVEGDIMPPAEPESPTAGAAGEQP